MQQHRMLFGSQAPNSLAAQMLLFLLLYEFVNRLGPQGFRVMDAQIHELGFKNLARLSRDGCCQPLLPGDWV